MFACMLMCLCEPARLLACSQVAWLAKPYFVARRGCGKVKARDTTNLLVRPIGFWLSYCRLKW